jgi:hypothetical protein
LEEDEMNSKEWREWFVRNPFGTDSGPILSDMEALEEEHSHYVNECNIQHNDDNAKIATLEKDRDEWKGMASRGATTNVEYMAIMEAAQDRAERAEVDFSSERAACEAAVKQWNKAESTLSRLREALERAIDGEHPEGLNKHHYVLPEGNPTRPEEFAFYEGVTEMSYEVHCILSAIFDEPKEDDPDAYGFDPLPHDDAGPR